MTEELHIYKKLACNQDYKPDQVRTQRGPGHGPDFQAALPDFRNTCQPRETGDLCPCPKSL